MPGLQTQQIITRLKTISHQYPVVVFFSLAIIISWGLWLPVFVGRPIESRFAIIPGGFGPAIAGVFLMWIRGESIRAWIKQCLTWRVGKRWYLVAVGLPLLLGIMMGLIFVGLTGNFGGSRLVQVIPMYPLILVFMILVGGGQEEFGWRGIALPALQERVPAVTASVILGAMWAFWHVPLFVFNARGYQSKSFGLYALLVVGFSIIFTWLYNNTNGSVFLAMILHGGINAASSVGGAFVADLSTIEFPLLLGYLVPVWLIALLLVGWFGSKTLSYNRPVTAKDVFNHSTLEVQI